MACRCWWSAVCPGRGGHRAVGVVGRHDAVAAADGLASRPRGDASGGVALRPGGGARHGLVPGGRHTERSMAGGVPGRPGRRRGKRHHQVPVDALLRPAQLRCDLRLDPTVHLRPIDQSRRLPAGLAVRPRRRLRDGRMGAARGFSWLRAACSPFAPIRRNCPEGNHAG